MQKVNVLCTRDLMYASTELIDEIRESCNISCR
jgi:hypothetical protein